MTFFSVIFTSISGAWESVLVNVISASEEFPASSETMTLSLPSSESLSPEFTDFDEPSFGVRVNSVLRVVETSSFHVATDSSPILSSLSETVRVGPEMILAEDLETVMTGAFVSFCSTGGLDPGSGPGAGVGSGSQQETAKDTTRSTAVRAVNRFFAALRK